MLAASPPIDRRARYGLAWATVVPLLWLIMMERSVHALFVVSLAALGLSPTLLAIPLLFSAFIYPLGLRRAWPHGAAFLTATTGVAIVAILLTIFAPSAWAVIFAAVSILALTILLFDVIAKHGRAMLAPCVLAVLLAITLATLNNSAAPGLTRTGVVLLLIVLAVAALLRRLTHAEPHVAASPPNVAGAGAVLAFLLVEYQLLAQPSQLATLHAGVLGTLNGPAPQAWWQLMLLVGSQLGLLLGLFLARSTTRDRRVLSAIAVLHFGAAALLVLGIAYLLAPAWVLLAQAGAVMLLAHALAGRGRGVAIEGMRAGLLQFGWWLLVVLHAFSTKWPFLPAFVWPLLVGRATLYLLLSFTVLPIAALLDTRERQP